MINRTKKRAIALFLYTILLKNSVYRNMSYSIKGFIFSLVRIELVDLVLVKSF